MNQHESSGRFKPSRLFQCRIGVTGSETAKGEQMKREVEKELLAELDSLLLTQDQLFSLALPVGDPSSRPADVPAPATLRIASS